MQQQVEESIKNLERVQRVLAEIQKTEKMCTWKPSNVKAANSMVIRFLIADG